MRSKTAAAPGKDSGGFFVAPRLTVQLSAGEARQDSPAPRAAPAAQPQPGVNPPPSATSGPQPSAFGTHLPPPGADAPKSPSTSKAEAGSKVESTSKAEAGSKVESTSKAEASSTAGGSSSGGGAGVGNDPAPATEVVDLTAAHTAGPSAEEREAAEMVAELTAGDATLAGPLQPQGVVVEVHSGGAPPPAGAGAGGAGETPGGSGAPPVGGSAPEPRAVVDPDVAAGKRPREAESGAGESATPRLPQKRRKTLATTLKKLLTSAATQAAKTRAAEAEKAAAAKGRAAAAEKVVMVTTGSGAGRAQEDPAGDAERPAAAVRGSGAWGSPS